MKTGHHRIAFLMPFLALAFAASSLAQDEIPTRVTAQNRTGDLPFSSSIGTDIEHVDVASGNLIVTIPLVVRKGRGMDFSAALRYNAHFWTAASRVDIFHNDINEWKIEQRDSIALGWQENKPSVTFATRHVPCNGGTAIYHTNFMYHDAGGGKHPLAIQGTLTPTNCPISDLQGPDMGADGIAASLLDGSDPFPDVTLADGTRIQTSSLEQRDANGNSKTEGSNWVDTLGRQIVSIETPPNQRLYRVYDSDGNQQTYTVNLGTIGVSTNFATNGDCFGRIREYSGERSVITSIVLPNGTSYQFQYETGSYGAITRIDLPSGAYITYTWATYVDGSRTRRRVASRTVHVDGQSHTWSFDQVAGEMTVTDPQNNQSVYSVNDTYGVITLAKFYEGTAGGTLLHQYQVDYVGDSDPWEDGNNPSSCSALAQLVAIRPIRVTTILDDGQVSKIEFDYETFNYPFHPYHGTIGYNQNVNFTTSRGNVTEIREYNYGAGTPGPLARRKTRTYLHNSDSTYKNYNIVSKVLTETLSDDVGVQKARTEYEYDTAPLTAATDAPQHDDTKYSAGFTRRGNITRVRRWRDTDGALPTTTYTYDTLGNILSISDALSHTTIYSYTDSWANGSCLPASSARAYVTQITNPLGHRTQFS